MSKLITLITLITASSSTVIDRRGMELSDIASPQVNQMQAMNSGSSLFPFLRRGLTLENINSPTINQQQTIHASESVFPDYEEDGFSDGFSDGFDTFSDGNMMTFSSFNNVGGVNKAEGAPSSENVLAPVLGGFLWRRKLDLSNMASPTVYMVQEIDSTGSYGGSSEGDNPYWENFGHLAASEFMN